jgi:hypothetical protein
MALGLFTMVPDSRMNSWVSWFIFNLRKINTNQYYESDFLSAGKATQYVNTWKYKTAMHDNYCTYLNSGLLEAPHEYVLHGLVPGLNWALFWPHPMSMHLVATPSSVSCCLFQQIKFHTQRTLLSGWLLTNVQVNITTTLYDTWYTSIYITLVLLFISSIYTSSIFLGRLAAPNSHRLLQGHHNRAQVIRL